MEWVVLKSPLLLLLAETHPPVCIFPWRAVVWLCVGHAVVFATVQGCGDKCTADCGRSASVPLLHVSKTLTCSMLLYIYPTKITYFYDNGSLQKDNICTPVKSKTRTPRRVNQLIESNCASVSTGCPFYNQR